MNVNINTEICSPNKCNHECISVCPQNKKNRIAIEIKKTAIINKIQCINCLQCVFICPLEAIEVLSKKEQKIPIYEFKQKKERKVKNKSSSLFEIKEELYNQFNERDTIFSRRIWDEDYKGYQKPIFEKAHERAAMELDGYSEIERAAVDAAWSIENIVSFHELQTERKKTLSAEEKQKFENQTNKTALKEVNYDVQNPYRYEVKDSKEMTIWLKKIAKFYGVDLIGITNFDPKWIYTHDRMNRKYVIPDSIKYVIVIASEMDFDAINTTPAMPGGIATGFGYSKMAFLRTLVSNFIQNLGYEAIPAGNSLGLSVPLAVEAGLGGWGRNGLLITRKYGPRVRIAKILTDIPLVADKPDYKFAKSVEKFCQTCKNCAQKCPSASIPFDKFPSFKTFSISNNPGIRKWYIDVETCYLFWLENAGDCSVCISDCEYNHKPSWWHKLANWIVMNLPIFNPIWPYIGKLFSFGGYKSAKKFWKKIKI